MRRSPATSWEALRQLRVDLRHSSLEKGALEDEVRGVKHFSVLGG